MGLGIRRQSVSPSEAQGEDVSTAYIRQQQTSPMDLQGAEPGAGYSVPCPFWLGLSSESEFCFVEDELVFFLCS